jgi:Na+/H+ antiporter NhaD/arsenite permease-like protein
MKLVIERGDALTGDCALWIARLLPALCALLALCAAGAAHGASAAGPPEIAGIRVEFLLFAATLLGVAFLHDRTLAIALGGLAAITAWKLVFTGFSEVPGLRGLAAHLHHERVIVANLFGLLVGFAALSKHFEDSRVPELLPRLLPDGWTGGLALLVVIFVLSAFLDNIAAALIGGAMAHTVFRGKVHIGYLAAIVACSNAGGAGSVVGDTTTTMMWLAGVSPLAVLDAYVAASVALVVCGIPAALQQHKHSPIMKEMPAGTHIDWTRVGIVAFILVAAIAANVTLNLKAPHLADRIPVIGLAVWAAILVSMPLRKPDWSLVPGAAKGSVFLLALVTCASLMPVEKLPPASWQSAFTLGFVSSVFDNIPLTALALKQGGYDWGMLAYAVGYGGSMIWFGSSAGVAISNMYGEAKSVGRWLTHGWHVTVAYVLGFAVMLAVTGWHPTPKRGDASAGAPPAAVVPVPGK